MKLRELTPDELDIVQKYEQRDWRWIIYALYRVLIVIIVMLIMRSHPSMPLDRLIGGYLLFEFFIELSLRVICIVDRNRDVRNEKLNQGPAESDAAD